MFVTRVAFMAVLIAPGSALLQAQNVASPFDGSRYNLVPPNRLAVAKPLAVMLLVCALPVRICRPVCVTATSSSLPAKKTDIA